MAEIEDLSFDTDDVVAAQDEEDKLFESVPQYCFICSFTLQKSRRL